MLSRVISAATKSIRPYSTTQQLAFSALNARRTFSTSQVSFAKEDPDAARNARLQAFLNQIRSTPAVYNQLKSVQLIIATKLESNGQPPSIMQQLSLLSDPEVRAEMMKLSEAMANENINISREDVGFLMQSLKAQVDDQSDGNKN